jgi:high-affinity Fe2+/Pb2+ permease
MDMHQLALGFAALVALAIIVIGVMYLSRPRATTRSFGLPLPEEGPNIAWWLRLKGVRDIATGLIVMAMMVWGGPHMVGIVLLVAAFIPIGDMLVILAAKGSARTAFSVHGLTALLMILAAISLTTRVS